MPLSHHLNLLPLPQENAPPLQRAFLIVASTKPFHPLYLSLKTLTYNKSCWWNKSHLHLLSKASLKTLISFIPKPPLSFGRHIFSKLTQAIFLLSLSLPHKKFLCKLTNLDKTTIGILKKEKKKRGRTLRIELMRHTLPTKEMSLCFHKDNFFFTFSIMGFHISSFLGLAPIGIPR